MLPGAETLQITTVSNNNGATAQLQTYVHISMCGVMKLSLRQFTPLKKSGKSKRLNPSTCPLKSIGNGARDRGINCKGMRVYMLYTRL